MRGYVNVPGSMYCKLCKECGSRPVIALIEDIGYIVKCSGNDRHYKTRPGVIDIEDWNRNNTLQPASLLHRHQPALAW